MKTDLMNIIFGMKVRKARTELGMSLSAFAKACRLSPSYLTEIEKGRKYPKRDKIFRISEVSGIDYDELVSIRLAPPLTYLESAFTSPLLGEFPLEEFGLDLGDLVEMLTRAPDKVSALLHAMVQIGRRYDMKEEHFLRAALRSHQELNDNYFGEIEESAETFAQQNNLTLPIDRATLETILHDQFNYTINNDKLAHDPDLSHYRSVVIKGRKPKLLINNILHQGQQKFLIAREIGHRTLRLKQRAYTSPPDVIESFEQVLNDFKASYFAGALMMPRDAILADIEHLFAQETWQPEIVVAMLEKYDATPEMLFYRLSELIPQHFGVDLHFLRFNDEDGNYRLIKQLNMNRLPLPSGFGLHEHYCRRWLTVRLIREMGDQPLYAGAQISDFLNTEDRFLCFGFGRPLALTPNIKTSVILGFRITADLKHTIRFADDPDIPSRLLSETCERCPLTPDQCAERAVEPRIWRKQNALDQRRKSLRALRAEMRG